ncbi:hypothetical protein EB796_024606 [Bugula neritina]|uniref:Uncharacterized protein n=1 Tax=Bugula neritina TaxID=10212 RepID=A0A7J7ITD5_BUGNE|nr:hypothetical protein EB796_024606 [Bugula neritina]
MAKQKLYYQVIREELKISRCSSELQDVEDMSWRLCASSSESQCRVSTKEKPREDPSEFTVEDTNKLLWWWQHSGKQQMTLAKDNVEKSKVFKNMAAHLEEKFTPTAVNNRFNYIKRKYKQSLTHNQKSSNNPSSIQYASQCEEAFYKDRDVNPIGVIDSEEIETRTPEKRSRSRLSKYQEEKLKIKREALQSKI